MPQLALTPKDKIAVKALIVSLNTRYGSKSPVTAVNWAKGTFAAQGAPAPRQFFLSPGARTGTIKVKVAGQSGVTKLPVAKPLGKVVKACSVTPPPVVKTNVVAKVAAPTVKAAAQPCEACASKK